MTIAEMKRFAEAATGVSSDAFHVILSVLVLLLAAAILRRSVAHPAPFLIVLALELVNEWQDLRIDIWPDRGVQLGEGAKDVLLTMLLPFVLLAVARWRPRLLRRDEPSAPAVAGAEDKP